MTEWVTSGAARLAADVHGSGPTILTLHPGVGDRRIWQAVTPGWVDAGFTVISYDRRGFGDTTCEPESHDPAADAIAVLDALGDGPAIVVGNSRGGSLALDLAVRWPERVRALVLIGATASGYPGEWVTSESEARMDLLVEAAEEVGTDAELNRIEAHYWLDGTDETDGRVSGPARELFLQMNGRAISAADPGPQTGAEEDVWAHLPELSVPVLVISGALDLPMFDTLGQQMADRLPNGSYVLLPGSAHCPQLDAPESLNTVVLQFLSHLG